MGHQFSYSDFLLHVVTPCPKLLHTVKSTECCFVWFVFFLIYLMMAKTIWWVLDKDFLHFQLHHHTKFCNALLQKLKLALSVSQPEGLPSEISFWLGKKKFYLLKCGNLRGACFPRYEGGNSSWKNYSCSWLLSAEEQI